MKSSTVGLKSVKNSNATQNLKKQIFLKTGKLDKFLLAQVAWCTIPAYLLVRMGQFRAGTIWCFVCLGAFLAWYALKRNIPAFVALTVASLPALEIIRNFFFYNSILTLLGLGLAFWFVRSPKECSRLWENQIIRWFFMTGTVYWVVSVLVTRQYYANLHVMEMLCSAASIYLLALYPKYLASALTGLSISIFSVAIGLFGQGERLGMGIIDGQALGQTYIIGFPAVLVLVLAVADNGKWLFLQNSPIVKNVLIIMCGVLLLLSTSRGSWLTACVGLGVAVFFQSQQRRKIFVGILLMGCVLVGVLQTQSGEEIMKHFERTTDSESTMREKTSGRTDMWLLFPKVLEDSPIWGVGPGLGGEAYAYYSWVDKEVTFAKGKKFAWHSIYMHVGVETGMIGLIVLTIFFSKLILRVLLYRQVTGNVVPLTGILSFMTVGLFVPGIDGLTGLFLGLAFLGTTLPEKKIMREIRIPS